MTFPTTAQKNVQLIGNSSDCYLQLQQQMQLSTLAG